MKKLVILLGIFLCIGLVNAEDWPLMSDFRPQGVLPSSASTVIMAITTDKTTQYCKYSTLADQSLSQMEYFSGAGTNSFNTLLTGLEKGKNYTYYIRCKSSVGGYFNPIDYMLNFSVSDSVSPEIINVQGDIINEEVIQISGLNFGFKSKALPIVWDNFENGINNENLKDHSQWIEYRLDGAKYSNLNSYSGELSVNNNANVSSTEGEEFSTNYIEFNDSDRIYATYRFKSEVSGYKGCTLKLSRIASNYGVYNGPGSMGAGNSNNDCTNSTLEFYFTKGDNWVKEDTSTVIEPSVWQRYDMYNKLSTPGQNNGEILLARNGKIGWKDFLETRELGFDFNLTFFLLGLMPINPSSDGQFSFFIDDVYVDNTLARVEICDKDNWNDIQTTGANCEIQIPQTWSDTNINIKINQGLFNKDDSVYLFIIDEDGNANNEGYPIIIGGSGAELDCVDEDGDGYGVGMNCLGSDCDDLNSSIHMEINCEYNGSSCGNFSFCSLTCLEIPEGACELGIYHEADLDEDGNISLNELVDYVELWLSGGISMEDVVEVVGLWKS